MSKNKTPKARARAVAKDVRKTVKAVQATVPAMRKDRRRKVAPGITTDGFANFVTRVGRGTDVANSSNSYVFDMISRNPRQLEAMYRGSWIVGAVVDSMAEDMTRAGITITSSEGAENIDNLYAHLSGLGVWNSYREAITWGRLYGGAIAVLQIEGQDLSTPLDFSTIGHKAFKGLAVYDRWQIGVDRQNLIEQGPDMGLPEFYTLVPAGNVVKPNGDKGGELIHHSRVIRCLGTALPYQQAIQEDLWGMSVIERLLDRLELFDNATISTGQLINRAYLRTIKVEKLRDILAAGGPAEEALIKMFEYVRMLQTNEGLTLIDGADAMETNAYSFAGLSEVLLMLSQQLSGASGIPLVRLMGDPPAGLNASGDVPLRLYYDKINTTQEGTMRGGTEKILKATYQSEFKKPMPEDMGFTFTPLWQLSATDKANVAKTTAEAIAGAVDAGLMERSDGMRELRGSAQTTGIFGGISDESITEAEDEPPMPDETQAPSAEELAAAGENVVPFKKPAIADRIRRMFRK